MDKTEA